MPYHRSARGVCGVGCLVQTVFGWERLDRWAIGLSGLCLAHCLASAVFIALLASAGGILLHPIFHEIGLTIAIGFGGLALGRGIMTHGYAMPAWIGGLGLGVMAGAMALPHGTGHGEVVYTILGVLILALGHDLNRRAVS
jgi:MerC mercury resistance protein